MTRGGDRAAAVASALLLSLAYPPFHLLLPSILCLVPVVVALEHDIEHPRPERRAALLGVWFGLPAYAITLHWMAIALWRFQPWQVLGFAAALLWLAAATGAAFAAMVWMRRRTALPMVLVFPVTWTTLEWLLAHQGPVSLPWLGLGTSLTGYPLLVQVADLIGARGITWLLAAANATLAAAWLSRHRLRHAARLTGAVALGCAAALGYGVLRVRGLQHRIVSRIAMVQTNVDAQERWTYEGRRRAVAQAVSLSRVAADGHADVIAWPETSLPGALLYHPEWERAVAEVARSASALVVAGGLDGVALGDGGLRFYNAAFLFGPAGQRAGVPYHKKHLVPVFELGNGIGTGEPGPVYQFPHGRVGILICGEITFESAARSYRRRGADALVNLSNDAWFVAGAGGEQHVAHLVMRAIETRAGVARAANGGISEIVDPAGRVQHRLPAGAPGVVLGFLTGTKAIPLYVRLGDWVGLLSLVATALFSAMAARRSRP